MSRRDEILRELGLTPIWRLRGTADDSPAAPGTASVPAPRMAKAANAAVSPGITVPPPVIMDDRRGAIMRMDWPELKARVEDRNVTWTS